MTSKIVVDSSPLIVLFKAGFADLLSELFNEVVVPDAVWNEVSAGGTDDRACIGLSTATWAIRNLPINKPRNLYSFGLGNGESEAISICLENQGSRVLVDDAAARRCAKQLGIPFIGTGGLLILAKQSNLIESVSIALDAVVEAGLWLSPEVVDLLKRKAGE